MPLSPPLPHHFSAVSVLCNDCAALQPGTRRISPGKTGSVFMAATCSIASPLKTLASCARFYVVGPSQAINCDGTTRCFIQVQLLANGGGSSYWLLGHTCGGQPVDVAGDYAQCGGGKLHLTCCKGHELHAKVDKGLEALRATRQVLASLCGFAKHLPRLAHATAPPAPPTNPCSTGEVQRLFRKRRQSRTPTYS